MLEVAQKYLQLKSGEYYKCFGKVDKVVGLTIESIGPKAKLNDLCMIFLDKERRDYVMSEVVGFKDSHIILMPFDNVEGVGVGCIVENTGHPLTVAVGDEIYAIALGSISNIEDIPVKDIKYVQAKEVIHLRGSVIPIIRLDKMLDIEPKEQEPDHLTVVIVQKGDQQAGLVVDNLIGQQEIVIKSLGKYINGNKLISGATILGDGDVALILDVNTLM